MDPRFDDGQWATLSCILEATAPKPGNVHPQASFADLSFADMVTASIAIGPTFRQGLSRGVGSLVLSAVEAMIQAVGKNTQLGSILLLAPIAHTPPTMPFQIAQTLDGMQELDSRLVYQAIRLAHPGGLGRVPRYDVNSPAPARLRDAMELAAETDLVARQYVNNFTDVLGRVVPWLQSGLDRGWQILDTIIQVQMQLMATFPDSLIRRKCGQPVARESQLRAQAVLASGLPGESPYQDALGEFDRWLRADGHRRNPGTTADLIAGGLFAGMRTGQIVLTARHRVAVG